MTLKQMGGGCPHLLKRIAAWSLVVLISTAAAVGSGIVMAETGWIESRSGFAVAIGVAVGLALSAVVLDTRARSLRREITDIQHNYAEAFRNQNESIADATNAANAKVAAAEAQCVYLSQLLAISDLKIASLKKEVKEKETVALVEQVRTYQGILAEGREEFFALLDSLTPLVEKYGEFIQTGEACHDRIDQIIRSLDGSLASLGAQGNRMVLSASLPSDPKFLFSDDGDSLSTDELHAAFRKMANIIHPDKANRANVSWLKNVFEVLAKHINSQYDELRSKSGTTT